MAAVHKRLLSFDEKPPQSQQNYALATANYIFCDASVVNYEQALP